MSVRVEREETRFPDHLGGEIREANGRHLEGRRSGDDGDVRDEIVLDVRGRCRCRRLDQLRGWSLDGLLVEDVRGSDGVVMLAQRGESIALRAGVVGRSIERSVIEL